MWGFPRRGTANKTLSPQASRSYSAEATRRRRQGRNSTWRAERERQPAALPPRQQRPIRRRHRLLPDVQESPRNDARHHLPRHASNTHPRAVTTPPIPRHCRSNRKRHPRHSNLRSRNPDETTPPESSTASSHPKPASATKPSQTSLPPSPKPATKTSSPTTSTSAATSKMPSATSSSTGRTAKSPQRPTRTRHPRSTPPNRDSSPRTAPVEPPPKPKMVRLRHQQRNSRSPARRTTRHREGRHPHA